LLGAGAGNSCLARRRLARWLEWAFFISPLPRPTLRGTNDCACLDGTLCVVGPFVAVTSSERVGG
jgi:hypothetical protein